jgi:hypothetical protein
MATLADLERRVAALEGTSAKHDEDFVAHGDSIVDTNVRVRRTEARLGGMEARLSRLERGVAALINHFGIDIDN